MSQESTQHLRYRQGTAAAPVWLPQVSACGEAPLAWWRLWEHPRFVTCKRCQRTTLYQELMLAYGEQGRHADTKERLLEAVVPPSTTLLVRQIHRALRTGRVVEATYVLAGHAQHGRIRQARSRHGRLDVQTGLGRWGVASQVDIDGVTYAPLTTTRE
jgi:hypothetical protein